LETVIRETQNIREMDILGRNTLLAYAGDIVIFGESKAELINSALNLLTNSEKKCDSESMKLKQNIRLLGESRQLCKSLRVGQYLFEQVEDFKYLGVNISQRNDMHNEVKLRLVSANRGYHTVRSILSSRLLPRETKTKLYISDLRPTAMYACETSSTTKGDELKLLLFEKKILRKMYGPILNPE